MIIDSGTFSNGLDFFPLVVDDATNLAIESVVTLQNVTLFDGAQAGAWGCVDRSFGGLILLAAERWS
jgi:hypothetical protein